MTTFKKFSTVCKYTWTCTINTYVLVYTVLRYFFFYFFYFSVYRISRLLELKESWTGAITINGVYCISLYFWLIPSYFDILFFTYSFIFSTYSVIFPSYSFLFSTYSFIILHIFHFFLHIFQIFLHIFYIFLHISFIFTTSRNSRMRRHLGGGVYLQILILPSWAWNMKHDKPGIPAARGRGRLQIQDLGGNPEKTWNMSI